MSESIHSDRQRRKRKIAAQLVTILVSAAILYVFLNKLSWEELAESLEEAVFWKAWLGVLIPFLVIWVIEASYSVKAFLWFHRPTPLKNYLVVKASAYLLSMINIAFSTGGEFVYFNRKTGVSFRKYIGMVFFRATIAAFGCVLVMAGLTVWILVFRAELARDLELEFWGPVIAALLLLMVDFYLYFTRGRGLLLKNLPFTYQDEFWIAFRMARLRHWFFGMCYSVPAVFTYILGLFFVARAFDVQVELPHFIFWAPLAALLSAFPVTFSGFGATTAAWMIFFSDYGTTADIVALTLFLPSARLLMRAVLGVLFMPAAMKEISSLAANADSQTAPPENDHRKS